MNDQVTLCEAQILTGPQFSEPMRVETARPNGPDGWIAGRSSLGAIPQSRVDPA